MLKQIFFATLFISVQSYLLRDPVSLKQQKNYNKNFLLSDSSYKWSEEWYPEMPIDHFSFSDSRDFELR